MPDLIAGALAQRNIDRAIKLLESEKDRGVFGANEIFLLSYLYCLNGSVEKAETLVADNAASIKQDWFVDWLWEKLQTDFGFHPLRSANNVHRLICGSARRFQGSKILKKLVRTLGLPLERTSSDKCPHFVVQKSSKK